MKTRASYEKEIRDLRRKLRNATYWEKQFSADVKVEQARVERMINEYELGYRTLMSVNEKFGGHVGALCVLVAERIKAATR